MQRSMITFRAEEVMAQRDPIARLIEYNRKLVGNGRDPSWMKHKLDRLTASPFGFLRGTFHLFMSDWPHLGDDPLNPGEPQPIVGDLHLENFGGFKAQDGTFLFDVNDFDESASHTPAVDLMRVTTSFLLADEKHGELRAVDRIEAFIDSYIAAVRAQDLRPFTAETAKLPIAVTEAIDEARHLSRGSWLEQRVAGPPGERHFVANDKYFPVKDPAVRAAVAEAVLAFTKKCDQRPSDCPSWGKMIDVAVRIAGTGSLGRFRYSVLMPGKGEEKGKELVLELKESMPSSMAPDDPSDQGERVIANQRLLQGASPGYLGVTRLAGTTYTVRELQPSDAKLDSESMKGAEKDELCASCGTVLGRLHSRGSRTLKARVEGRDRALRRRVAAFALRYAEIVDEDFETLVRRRDEVERALGL
jgi:uncharacterized protein (DUF2252 family)